MPTYDYECEKGHTFELIQKITEEALDECQHVMSVQEMQETVDAAWATEDGTPLCNAPCKRLISAPGIILKGDGWARDGYSGSKK